MTSADSALYSSRERSSTIPKRTRKREGAKTPREHFLGGASSQFLPPLRGGGSSLSRYAGPGPGLPSGAPPGRTAGKDLPDAPVENPGGTLSRRAPSWL